MVLLQVFIALVISQVGMHGPDWGTAMETAQAVEFTFDLVLNQAMETVGPAFPVVADGLAFALHMDEGQVVLQALAMTVAGVFALGRGFVIEHPLTGEASALLGRKLVRCPWDVTNRRTGGPIGQCPGGELAVVDLLVDLLGRRRFERLVVGLGRLCLFLALLLLLLWRCGCRLRR